MKSANPPARHHYIPEGYMKSWCNNNSIIVNKEDRILTKNSIIKSPYSESVSTRSTGFMWHLYDADARDISQTCKGAKPPRISTDLYPKINCKLKPGYLEKHVMSDIDDKGVAVLDKLRHIVRICIDQGIASRHGRNLTVPALSDQEYTSLSKFVFSLLFRMPSDVRAVRQAMNPESFPEIASLAEQTENHRRVLREILFVTFFESFLGKGNLLSKVFQQCGIHLFISPHGEHYRTSDRPVQIYRTGPGKLNNTLTLPVCRNSMLVMPLTPRAVRRVDLVKGLPLTIAKHLNNALVSMHADQFIYTTGEMDKMDWSITRLYKPGPRLSERVLPVLKDWMTEGDLVDALPSDDHQTSSL